MIIPYQEFIDFIEMYDNIEDNLPIYFYYHPDEHIFISGELLQNPEAKLLYVIDKNKFLEAEGLADNDVADKFYFDENAMKYVSDEIEIKMDEYFRERLYYHLYNIYLQEKKGKRVMDINIVDKVYKIIDYILNNKMLYIVNFKKDRIDMCEAHKGKIYKENITWYYEIDNFNYHIIVEVRNVCFSKDEAINLLEQRYKDIIQKLKKGGSECLII